MSGDPNAKVIFTEDNARRSCCPDRQDGRPVSHNLVPGGEGRKRKAKTPVRIWPTDFS